MIVKKKSQVILAISVICAFLCQSCASVIFGEYKKIPVTSNPLGAKVMVDGKEMGYTPLNLRLKKKHSHMVMIEANGYNPLNILITQKISGTLAFSILGNILMGYLGLIVEILIFGKPSFAFDEDRALIGGVFLAGWIGGIVLDFISGANYFLSPEELNVTLTKIEGNPHQDFIFIDAEKFQNIKWIRIKSK